MRAVVSLAATGVMVALLLPRLSGWHQPVATLRSLSIPLAVAAMLLEGLSLLAYSAMTSLVFGTAVRFSTLLRIDLTATGLSHAVPAGGATAAAMRMRLLQHAGVPGSSAVAGATVQATAANLVLGAVFVVGTAILVVDGSDTTSYLAVSAGVLVGTLVALALAWLLLRHGPGLADRLAGRAARRRVLRGHSPEHLVRALHLRLLDLVGHPSRTGRVLGCAALNWLLDATVLWLMLAATGVHLPVGPLLVVYGLGNLLAIVPLTPGGLGIVEGVMIPALIGFGLPHPVALVGVLGWRVWQFWLPIPVAGICYLSLRVERLVRERRRG